MILRSLYDGTLSLAVWLWSGESFVRLISGPEMFKMFVFDINKRETDIFICQILVQGYDTVYYVESDMYELYISVEYRGEYLYHWMGLDKLQ